MHDYNFSGYLFARPSFLEGVARAFDLGGSLNEYNRTITPEQADYLGFRADWQAVGDDLWRALRSQAAATEEPAPSR